MRLRLGLERVELHPVREGTGRLLPEREGPGLPQEAGVTLPSGRRPGNGGPPTAGHPPPARTRPRRAGPATRATPPGSRSCARPCRSAGCEPVGAAARAAGTAGRRPARRHEQPVTARRPAPATVALAALALAATATAVVVIGSPSTSSAGERTVSVARGVIQSTVSGSGTLAPANQLELNFGAGGEVTRVYVHAGEHVRAGELLATIDPSTARVTLAQAKADLQSAQDTLSGAQSGSATTATTASAATAAAASTSARGTVAARAAQAPTSTTPTTTTPTTTPTDDRRRLPDDPDDPDDADHDDADHDDPEVDRARHDQEALLEQPRERERDRCPPASGGGSAGGASGSGGTGSAGGATSVASAEAAVASAQLSVKSAERALAATKLRAPMPGTIAAVNGAVGDTVGTGSSSSSSSSSGGAATGGGGATDAAPSSSSSASSGSGFVTLAQISRYKMSVSLSESDIDSVKVGQPATVTVNAASGEEFAAHVAAIGVLSSSSQSSGTSSAVSYPVTLTLDQTGTKLKAGMSASADIVTAQVSGITVPIQALSGSTVTLERGGKRTTQRVETGVTGDSTTQVLSGLKVGDQVVVRSASAAAGASATSAAGQASGVQGTRLGGAFGGGRFRGGAASEAAAASEGRRAPREPAPRGGPSPSPAGHRRRGRRAGLPDHRRSRRLRAGRRVAAHPARGLRRDHGQLRQRQDDADEHPRLPGRAHGRPLPARRRRRPRHRRGRPRRPAQPQDRLRLPELQPRAPHDRAGQRRAAAGVRRPAPRRAPAPRGRRARVRRHGQSAPITCPPSSRAASSSASRSPARSSPIPRSSSPTSRPATSTRTRPARSSRSSAGSTPPAERW